MSEKIKVSIIMCTYNHSDYIRHALDSVLEQETDFKYEVIIGDDCSTDGTQDILKEYKRKYPDKINLILHKKNIGAINNGYSVIKHVKGEYIATLEGDDYWCNKTKLQMQVDFLDAHKEYVGCVHGYHVVDQNDRNINVLGCVPLDYSHKPYKFKNNECTIRDYENFQALPSHANTLMYRNLYINDTKRYNILFKMHYTGDQTIYVWLLSHGKIYMHKDDMSAYRWIKKIDGTNMTSVLSRKNNRAENYVYQCKLERAAKKYWGCEVNLSKEKRNLLIGAVCVCMNDMTKENVKVVIDIVKYSQRPIYTVFDIGRIVAKKMYYKYIKKSDERILP